MPKDVFAGQVPPNALDTKGEEDVRSLRSELRTLRQGMPAWEVRVRKARRELARTKRQQKDAERTLAENEARVALLAQRLGCESDGLPEIDAWRDLAREHALKEQELKKTMAAEKATHAKRLEDLRAKITRGGRPETAKSLEVVENRARRIEADDLCFQLQATRDYVTGALPELPPAELRDLLAPTAEADEADEDADESFAEKVLAELRTQHQQALKDVVSLSNEAGEEHEQLAKALEADVLDRGLEDVRSLSTTERRALRELLPIVQASVNDRLAAMDFAEVDEGS